MSYTVKLYIDSGYTAGNRPDSPARLEADSTVVTLSKKARLVQDCFLVQITVGLANNQNIEVDKDHVDFMKVGSFYYKVTGSDWATPGKACVFYLSMEHLLSRGGIDTIAFISGLVRRYNPTSDDYGEYCLDDEYMAPSEPLRIAGGSTTVTAEAKTHLIQSTLELVTQGFLQCISVPVTNDKSTTSDIEDLDPVVFYQTVPTPFTTAFGVGSDTTHDIYEGGSCIYRIEGTPTTLRNKAIFGGIDAARQLGAEGAILASYEVPSKFLQSDTGGSITEQSFTLQMGHTTNPFYGNFTSGSAKIGMISNAKNTSVTTLYVLSAAGGSTEATQIYIPCAVVNEQKYGDIDKNGYNPIGGLNSTGATQSFYYVSRLAGGEGQVTDVTPPTFEYNTLSYTPANKRVYYGNYTPYVLATLAGNQKQCNAEMIYETGEASPHIMQIADVRPSGTVYYYFKNYSHGGSGILDGVKWGFMVGSLQWNNVPLTYTDVSGGKLKQQQFTQSRQSADLAYNQATRGFVNRALMKVGDFLGGDATGTATSVSQTAGGIGTAATIGAGFAKAAAASAATETAGGILTGTAAGAGTGGAIAGTAAAALPLVAVGAGAVAYGAYRYGQLNKTRETYLLERANETASYLSNTSVAVPTVAFPQDNTLARAQYGEHPIVYRYEYTLNDLKRIDKILTMYGYKVCEPADVSMLNSHQAFNYFEGNVQVTNADGTEVMPQWMADGIAEELSAGVRLWHQRPIEITADCNPVKS